MKGLLDTYNRIEDLLNQFRKEDENFKEDHSFFQKNHSPIIVPGWCPKPQDHDYITPSDSRLTFNLNNDYIVKVIPEVISDNTFIAICPVMSRLQAKQEETNVELLREYGFTKQNGFLVPDHKIVGLRIENNQIKIDPKGIGLTIADDLSGNGTYLVSDISEVLIDDLDNAEEFTTNYQRHIEALLSFYHHPEIIGSINRHSPPENPLNSIKRMLLARVKDKVGEIAIGDLDNIFFEKVLPK